MDSNKIELSSEQEICIINLINKIIAKSPHLTELNAESIVFIRLVSVITLIESTLCSKYQIVLKRNSTDSQSIELIKSWLHNYYDNHFISSLCLNDQTVVGDANESAENGIQDNTDLDIELSVNNNNTIKYTKESISRDISLISLLILFIAHKLRQSLPRINAYFSPEWQTLSEFDSVLNRLINFDKLLDLVQNELCVKRKQLEVTKSKVQSLQTTLNTRVLEQNKQKKSKLDFHSNLFAEYEDNDSTEEKDVITFDDTEERITENTDESDVFIDNSSDDDYRPKKKINKLSKNLHKNSKNTAIIKSGRKRGRPSKESLNAIQITPQIKSGAKPRGRPPKLKSNPITIESESEGVEGVGGVDEPFECEVCGKRFAKEYRLTRHSFTHLGHKQFRCDFPDCMESFDLKWKLAKHKHEHNGHNTTGYEDDSFNTNHYFQCEWADCGLGFQSKRELTVHEHEMHANRSTSKYSCDWPQCKEIFENKIDWRKHVKTHGKIVPTECGFPGCHKSFYNLNSLENHRKIHETFTLNDLS